MDPKRHPFLTASLAALAVASLTGCIPTSPGAAPQAPREGYVLAAAVDVPPPPASPEMDLSGGVNLPAPPAPQAELAETSKAQPAAPIAPPPPIAQARPTQRIHVVSAGQTLWRISGMYYGRASREGVERIVRANPAVTNPNVIYIGQKLIIPE